MVKTSSFSNLRLPQAPRRVLLKRPPARVQKAAEKKDAGKPHEPETARTAALDPALASIDVHAISENIRLEVQEEYAEKWRFVGELLNEASKLKARALQESETIILHLAFEISKKIVRSESKINPEMCVENLREALRRIHAAETLTIWLNPRDLEFVGKNDKMKDELESKAPQFKLKSRADIAAGGCIVESDIGVIDATIESQLAEIERLFDEVAS